MPTTAIINLRALTSGPFLRSFHCLMHPVFLDRVSRANPNMGEMLHDAGIMTPFSISPIMGLREKVVENKTYWVRIGILSDELESIFADSLEKGLWNEPIRLENHIFAIEDVILGNHEKYPWSGRHGYLDLVISDINKERLSLFIASPMSFKRGDLHYPMPEISLIFGNLTRRWNAFSDFVVPDDLDYSNISFSFIDIKTEPYFLRKGGTVIGSVGKLAFVFKGRQEDILCFQTLLRFAFYSGIGVKTTQGMGMCKVV